MVSSFWLPQGRGREKWHLELFKSFEAERPEYGYSESVLIYGDKLFCCPGARRAMPQLLRKERVGRCGPTPK